MYKNYKITSMDNSRINKFERKFLGRAKISSQMLGVSLIKEGGGGGGGLWCSVDGC